jgi:hypothetical protein
VRSGPNQTLQQTEAAFWSFVACCVPVGGNDVSQLPPEAVQSRTETGGPGKPETRLTLNMDYEVEIVDRLAAC